MKIFIITQDDPVYAPVYLTKIIQRSQHPVIGITALSPAGHKGWLKLVRERLDIYGFRDFLRAIILYSYCRLRGFLPPKKLRSRFYSVKQVAKYYSIPIYPCTNVNHPGYVNILKSLAPDILTSVAANQRFKNNLLNTPRRVCLNVHSALLPKYRGIDGLFWALVHGETEVGVTVHLMNEKFDAGDIVAQQPFAVEEHDTLHQLYFKAIDVGSRLLAKVIDDFAAGTVVTKTNDIKAGSYFSNPTSDATRQFRKRGRKFF